MSNKKTKRAVYFYSNTVSKSLSSVINRIRDMKGWDSRKDRAILYEVSASNDGRHFVARKFRFYGEPILADSPEELVSLIKEDLDTVK